MDDWFGFQGGLVAVGLLATVSGCKDPDPDTDTTTGNTTSTEPASTGDTPTGSGSASGTTGDTPTGSGSASGTTGDVDVPPVCVAYGAKVAECNMDPMEPVDPVDVEQQCALILMQFEAYGADCVQGYEAYLACTLALSCAELGSDPPKCEAEMLAVETACVPEVPPVCESYGAKFAECLMEPAAAMAYAQMCGTGLMYYAKYYGADCVQASEAWFACLSALSCEEFLGGTMGDIPVCEVEDMARNTACN